MKMFKLNVVRGTDAVACCVALVSCGGGNSNKESRPKIIRFSPSSGAQQVMNTVGVSADFDRDMTASSFSSDTVRVACPVGTPASGEVSYLAVKRQVSFTPSDLLPTTVECTVQIDAGVKDSTGVAMGNTVQWKFSTVLDVAFIELGKQIFREDTFGDETQWTDTLRMHEVISSAVDPVTALSVGLKVDAEALPAGFTARLQPATERTSPTGIATSALPKWVVMAASTNHVLASASRMERTT